MNNPPIVMARNKGRYTNGARFGTLIIIERHHSGSSRHPRFKVRCDCGAEYCANGSSLAKAKGCRQCFLNRPRAKKYGPKPASRKDPLYRAWVSMRNRCRNPRNKGYRLYGGRGISIAPQWENFAFFRDWSLSNGFHPGLSIDRINVDGDYGPDNCEWVTKSENSKRCRAMYDFVRRGQRPWPFSDGYLPIEALYGNV